MISVMHQGRFMQQSSAFLAVCCLTAILGCQPGEAKKNVPENKTPASPTSVETTPKDMPGVETPVKDLPGNEPAKETPAKETPAKTPALPKTSAVESPVAGKVAGQAAAAEDPTLEVTVKWLPKPPDDNPAAEAADQAGMKAYTQKIPGADAAIDMAPIPGGTFIMGSPDNEKGRKSDEGPQVDVKLQPFWMGKYEITWGQYELWGLGLDKQRREAKKAEATHWDKTADALAIPTKPYSDMTFGMGKEGFPAVCMTQFAAKMYCKWLSAKTGHYYRLPTEAEWEYACRAGTKTAYSFGDDPKKLGDYAWSSENSDEKYHKVGLKKPNPWGLYDMHGNVAEWCIDEYVPDRYKQLHIRSSNADAPVLVTKAYPQVVRGGAWTDEAPALRSAARRGSSKEWKQQDPQIPQSIWYHTDADFVGFRVVRPLHVPSVEEAARYEVTEFEKQDYLDYKKSQAGKQ